MKASDDKSVGREGEPGKRECRFEIVNRLGLHARAAAKLVRLANGLSSEIRLSRAGGGVNGKSILGGLMLADHRPAPAPCRDPRISEEKRFARRTSFAAARACSPSLFTISNWRSTFWSSPPMSSVPSPDAVTARGSASR